MPSITKKCRHRGADCGCVWYARERIDGRDVYTRLHHDRRVAERMVAQAASGRSVTVRQVCDEWYAKKASAADGRANSLHTYRSRLKHVIAYFGDMPVGDVRPRHLARFADDLQATGRAASTCRGIYACAGAVLRHAVRCGYIESMPTPADGSGIPAPAPRVHALTLPQVEQVIGRLASPYNLLAELVLLTGLRWGEVVAIEPADIQDGVLTVRRTATRYGGVNPPKTRSGIRLVPLSDRAHEILMVAQLPFRVTYRASRDALIEAMGELHRPGVGWHTIRNAHATLLDAAGVTIRDQAVRMGHGVRHAQTLAYGLRSQAGSAQALDLVRGARPLPTAPEPAQVVPLDALRAHRRGRTR